MDENLDIVTVGSFKIYEDQEHLKADTILVIVAKQLFSEGTHKNKVTIVKIITHHDNSLIMLLTGKRMIQLQESISKSLIQQGIECGTGQRHCRLTPLTSKMKIRDLEERCKDMENCDMYEMVTEIILD